MGAVNLNSLFLGSVPAEQRKYIRALLEHYREMGYTKVHIPCAGQFTVVKCAIEAGYRKEDIYASDVCLFSNILGYLYSKKPIDSIDFELVEGNLIRAYKKASTDVEKSALLYLAIKKSQLKLDVDYEKGFYDELCARESHYLAKLRKNLADYVKYYEGINYEIKDVRDYFDLDKVDKLSKDTLLFMNPPEFSKGYQKMFQFDLYIKYTVPVEEFDFKVEWLRCYDFSKDCTKIPYLWYTSQSVAKKLPAVEVIGAKENGKDKFSYFITPKPELLKGFKEKYAVMFKKQKGFKDVRPFEMYPKDRELTKEDIITIVPVDKDTALYYRDLFAHRLGATVAEVYFAVLVNEKLISTCGFNTSFLRRLQETYVFENFCFSIAHKKYENLNRLSMMCLCSGQFKKYLVNVVLKESSYVLLDTFRTVCLTDRKSKLNNGLLTLISSEIVEENGMYKLTYEQPFYMDRDYKKCLELFLDNDVRFKKNNKEGKK